MERAILGQTALQFGKGPGENHVHVANMHIFCGNLPHVEHVSTLAARQSSIFAMRVETSLKV